MEKQARGQSLLAKRSKDNFLTSITILVGPEEVSFTAHSNIICESSDFFRAAVEGEWKDSNGKLVRLPEIDAAVFGVYLDWLYTGQVDAFYKNERPGDGKPRYAKIISDEARSRLVTTIISAFAIGDMLQDMSFRNAVVNEFIERIERTDLLPGVREVCFLWDTVPHFSTLTRLCVDYLALEIDPRAFEREGRQYPEALVFQVALASLHRRGRSMDVPASCRRCMYHKHVEGKGKTNKCA